MSRHPLPKYVIALTPSKGLGGGIESYAVELLSAFEELGVKVVELPFLSPGLTADTAEKIRYLMRVLRSCWRLRGERIEVLCCHPGLLPVGLLARSVVSRSSPLTIAFYGGDIWGASHMDRRMHRLQCIRPITVSSFSAGALTDGMPTLLLPPTVREELFDKLVTIPRPPVGDRPMEVLSVFRLDSYRNKGGFELAAAVERLRAEGYAPTLTIAGLDAPTNGPDDDLLRGRDWLRLVRSPTMDQLVGLYAEADVFVLATRQQRRPRPSGEGFGIVLAEAALAGLPVVAPANDGSSDAFVVGLTGLRPPDQSVDSLTDTLRWLLQHKAETQLMGRNARMWAKFSFDRRTYTSRVRSVFWGQGFFSTWLGLTLEEAESPRISDIQDPGQS